MILPSLWSNLDEPPNIGRTIAINCSVATILCTNTCPRHRSCPVWPTTPVANWEIIRWQLWKELHFSIAVLKMCSWICMHCSEIEMLLKYSPSLLHCHHHHHRCRHHHHRHHHHHYQHLIIISSSSTIKFKASALYTPPDTPCPLSSRLPTGWSLHRPISLLALGTHFVICLGTHDVA
jgi:hypothetical protein